MMDSILKDFDKTGTILHELHFDKNELMIFDKDHYFVLGLNKPQVQQLINELQSLHDQMID